MEIIANLEHGGEYIKLNMLLREAADAGFTVVLVDNPSLLCTLEELWDTCKTLKLRLSLTVKPGTPPPKLCDYLKIPSSVNRNQDILRSAGSTGKPVYISLGTLFPDEIQDVLHTVLQAGRSVITLQHCVSEHPVPEKDAQLAFIGAVHGFLAQNTQNGPLCRIGYADHTGHEGAIYRAAFRWGVPSLELHFGLEADKPYIWSPSRAAVLIKNLLGSYDGDGSRVMSPKELEKRKEYANDRSI